MSISDPPQPSNVTLLRSPNEDPVTSLMVKWEIDVPVYNISQYSMQLYQNDGFTDVLNITDGTVKTFHLTNVSLGQSYSVSVRSVSNSGNAPPSFSKYADSSLQQRTGSGFFIIKQQTVCACEHMTIF